MKSISVRRKEEEKEDRRRGMSVVVAGTGASRGQGDGISTAAKAISSSTTTTTAAVSTSRTRTGERITGETILEETEGEREESLTLRAAAKAAASKKVAAERLLGNGREAESKAISATASAMRMKQQGGSEPSSSSSSSSMKRLSAEFLEKAYVRCGVITEEYAKTFYLGTQLMTEEKRRAIWAIYVWCRRTDELVDGPNASHIDPVALDRWEERLDAIFAGKPYDLLDAALADTVTNFPLAIEPFRDMIDGMRMDLYTSRYRNFEELYTYCYRVAGTVGLMTTPVMGIDPAASKVPLEEVCESAIALGIANQLTNILRDVGEDAQERDRIYVPLSELEDFGVTQTDVLTGMFNKTSGRIDDKWRSFMRFQIKRARDYFEEAEEGVKSLDPDAKWPVLSALTLYQQILDSIEKNDYDNFTQRAYVKKVNKLVSLPIAFAKTLQFNMERDSA